MSKTRSEYNSRRTLNHVNASHATRKSSFTTNTPRGAHFAEENDKISQTGQDYGRIRLVAELGDGVNEFVKKNAQMFSAG